MIRWQPTPSRGRRLGRAVGVPVTLALALGVLTQTVTPPVLINESPSLPQGLYWRAWGATPTVGSVVAIAQPPRVRAYLSGLGLPGEVLLIKRVAATGSDDVCIAGQTLRTPSGRYAVRDRDRIGRALPVWSGCRRLDPGELFLLGDTETSFDSRYFGPVDRADVLGVYTKGPTW